MAPRDPLEDPCPPHASGDAVQSRENADVGYAEASELADLCGLAPTEFVSFRLARLAQHETLIRVTADLSVPDGPNYEDLGISLRTWWQRSSITMSSRKWPSFALRVIRLGRSACLHRPRAGERLFERRARVSIRRSRPVLFRRLFGKRAQPARRKESSQSPAESPGTAAVDHWQAQLAATSDTLEKACLEGLIKIVGGILGHRGRLVADRELIGRLVANHVCSHHAGRRIGEVIGPLIEKAVAERNYRVLPPQREPTVMNVKGASASGKSTIRPRQRHLAEKLGIPWEDFALISPDYWRKYLLDYGTLGDDYKYAAMLTGQELEIIDKKLDRYMAEKAARGAMSHLLIDRFRFDSFVVEDDRGADSTLLTRFGHRIFMFFMITPPAETIERAWQRGLSTGRYKAVDDLLYHNVEAYTGMPGLFFSWVHSKAKRIHFEFLDNDVPKGELPKTAAFGWNDTMTILDPRVMIDIDRYRKVDVEATDASEIFRTQDMEASLNTGFLKRCREQIPRIRFADPVSAKVYATVVDGKLCWCDHRHVEAQPARSGVRTALEALGYEEGLECDGQADAVDPIDIERESHFTLGRWNEKA
ncbi:MAG: hypothetical protein R3C97_19335 [Geminicoccaceae bacterium]